jgi:hypothetical protein
VNTLAFGLLTFFKMIVSGQAWIVAGLIALAIYAGSDSWSGLATALPHRVVGSPTTPYSIPWPDLAMTLGFLASLALPVVWLAMIRPRILGKRFSNRIFERPLPEYETTKKDRAWPGKADFRGDVDSWDRASGRSQRRDALDRNPKLALLWITIQISLVIGLVITPPWLAAHYVPGASFAGVLAVLGVVALLSGGMAVGVKVSGARGGAKLPLGLLGLLLGAMVITLPLVAMLYRGLAGIGLVVLLYAICSAIVILLGRRLTSSKPPRGYMLFTTVLWIAQWPIAIGLLAWRAPGIDQTLTVGTGVAAVVAGVIFCVHQFGWYLFVTYLWGAHNNEAGAAVRCEKYKQWIRFHLKDDVLTGYVIGIDDPVDDPSKQVAVAKVVDVFQIKPGGA